MNERTGSTSAPVSRHRVAVLSLGALAAVGAILVLPPGGSVIPSDVRAGGATGGFSCQIVAATSGSDRQPGTVERPVRTVARLLERLPRNGVGCLRGGRFTEDVKLTRRGHALRSFPGERATIRGRFWVSRTATGARVSDLVLDGRSPSGLPSPTINGSRATFTRNEVTNANTGICFLLGSEGYGRPSGTVIDRNRIHDCGRLPSRNRDHGIYVAGADGTTISDNVIYDNADRGIQLYPDAKRTMITGNVLYRNGEGVIFSGGGGKTSSLTTVTGNVVAYSQIRADVESFYPPGTPRGRANVVSGNCIFGGRDGTVNQSGGGFSSHDNVEIDPSFANPERGDFRVRSGRCAATVKASRAPAGPRGEPPVAR